MRSVTGTVALAAVAVAVSGCGIEVSGKAKHHESRSYDVSGEVSALTVNAEADQVELVGTDATKITVQERLAYSKGGRPTPQHTIANGVLSLGYKCPGGISIGIDPACGVSYRVSVPRRTDVHVTGDGSKIRVAGMAGSVIVRGDSGTVDVADLRSPELVVTTDSGTIRVTGQATKASLRSDSGTISAKNLKASVFTARTDSGTIRAACVEAPSQLTAISESGTVELLLPGDRKYAVETRTDAGAQNIDVDRDSTSPLEVKVTTDSGSIKIAKA